MSSCYGIAWLFHFKMSQKHNYVGPAVTEIIYF